MYRIVKREGGLVGLCDKPHYIYRDPISGTLYKAFGEEDAEGVAFQGTPYNIGEEEIIPGADFVYITEIDGGEYQFNDHEKTIENSREINTAEKLLLEQDNATAELQEELDVAETLLLEQDNDICLLQEALMELDNQIKGRTTK